MAASLGKGLLCRGPRQTFRPQSGGHRIGGALCEFQVPTRFSLDKQLLP